MVAVNHLDPWQEFGQQVIDLGEIARALVDSDLIDHTPRQITDNYKRELIQLAASAFAALEDLEVPQSQIIDMVQRERIRQDDRFGAMPRHKDPLMWIGVLAEELGEVAQEVS